MYCVTKITIVPTMTLIMSNVIRPFVYTGHTACIKVNYGKRRFQQTDKYITYDSEA